MQRQADPLRLIADRLSIPSLGIAIKQPGVAEALRVTVQYHDGKHPDQVATLLKMQSSGPTKLAVHYRRTIDKPLLLNYIIEPERFTLLNTTLRKLTFDKLDDFSDIPWHGEDIWLVERAAGSFRHDILIPPDSATGIHAEIVKLIRERLSEAVRVISI